MWLLSLVVLVEQIAGCSNAVIRLWIADEFVLFKEGKDFLVVGADQPLA